MFDVDYQLQINKIYEKACKNVSGEIHLKSAIFSSFFVKHLDDHLRYNNYLLQTKFIL